VDEDIDMVADHSNAEKYRYCTECVIVLKPGATKDQMTQALQSVPNLGDSMVCVSGPATNGKDQMCKVHIHSDDPDLVYETCATFNKLALPLKEKNDDMQRQIKNARRSYDAAKFKVTFIGDSTALTEPWAESGMAHVPIISTIKGEPYANSFDPPGLNVVDFLNKSRHEEMKVGTAAPGAELWRRLFDAAIPIGKPIFAMAVSGWVTTAQLKEVWTTRLELLASAYIHIARAI
jgi:dihydroxyacetone kinase-like predicted kinase